MPVLRPGCRKNIVNAINGEKNGNTDSFTPFAARTAKLTSIDSNDCKKKEDRKISCT